ncbi:MAG: hypothetical protein NT176_17230 [Proteobacteria bacterium]|nr:hypothetical protein [Pseudomonadota bacterium]
MKQDPYRLVYGDIHNHNAHGYGTGSIERRVDIARSSGSNGTPTISATSAWCSRRTFSRCSIPASSPN